MESVNNLFFYRDSRCVCVICRPPQAERSFFEFIKDKYLTYRNPCPEIKDRIEEALDD